MLVACLGPRVAGKAFVSGESTGGVARVVWGRAGDTRHAEKWSMWFGGLLRGLGALAFVVACARIDDRR